VTRRPRGGHGRAADVTRSERACNADDVEAAAWRRQCSATAAGK
jgi:hypothetical protein